MTVDRRISYDTAAMNLALNAGGRLSSSEISGGREGIRLPEGSQAA